MKRAFLSLLLVTSLCTDVIQAQGANNLQYLVVVQGDLPLYPAVARTARVSGSVRVEVTVKDGEVTAAEVLSGHPLLAPPTAKNIKTWKFAKTVNAKFITTFRYRLEKAEDPETSNPKIELELPILVTVTARSTKGPCHDCDSDISAKPIEH
jgi:hypothetical protein